MKNFPMTREVAEAYPVIYAPLHAFAWEGEFLGSVRRVISQWSDGMIDHAFGSVLGWVDKHELEMFQSDDEVQTLAFLCISRPGVCVWVAGSDLLHSVSKYEPHIEIIQPNDDSRVSVDELDLDDLEKVVADDLEYAHHWFENLTDEDEAVLEEISLEMLRNMLESERQAHAETGELLDYFENLVGEMIAENAHEFERATEWARQIELARGYVRRRLDTQLATPMNRRILQHIGENLCKWGQGDEPVKEHTILFGQDNRGRTDQMQVFLAHEGKVVDVRISNIF